MKKYLVVLFVLGQTENNETEYTVVETSSAEIVPVCQPSDALLAGSASNEVTVGTPTDNNDADVVDATTPDLVAALDPDILSALGAQPEDELEYGPKIHDNLSKLWLPLLKKGMPKEEKDKIMKSYLVPENCKLLQSPKLNLEIAAAITESARGRDKKLASAQQQLGIGISAVNRALDALITKEDNCAVKAIKHLSDACRVLCDLHYIESQSRIKMITPSLDKNFLNIIQDTHRDETLFGVKIAEKIKSSKTIEKQGLQIKKVTAPIPSSTASTSRPTQARGNWSGPPRYSSNKSGRGPGKKTSSSSRKAPPPPPPPAATTAAKQHGKQTRAPAHQ